MGYPSAAHRRMTRSSVKDLASCFCSTHIPLVEESDTLCISTQPIVPDDKHMGFNCRGENGHKKVMSSNVKKETGEWDQRRRNSSLQSNNVDQISRKGDRRLSEEDYIVFCFKKNGEIDMISDGRPSKLHHVYDSRRSSTAAAAALRPITRKLQYSESIELMWDSRRGVMVSPRKDGLLLNGNEPLIASVNKDGGGKANINGMSTARPPDEKTVKDPNLHFESKTGQSIESCGSNLSESSSSTDSFTFPKLGAEWIGSPVYLPKAEECKGSSYVMGLHCCRF